MRLASERASEMTAAGGGGGKDVYLVVYNGFMTVVSLLSFASVLFTILNRGLGKLWLGAGAGGCGAWRWRQPR